MNIKKWLSYIFVPGEHNHFRPGIFRDGSALGITVFLLGMFAFSFLGTLGLGEGSFLAEIRTAVLIDLANEERVENKLAELTPSDALTQAAQLKANDMATHGYFQHTSPLGVTPWHWFGLAGYDFAYAGENLAVNFDDSEDVNRAWLASPTHRENIMSANFTEIGIATAQGLYEGQEVTFVVQLFGKPKANIQSLFARDITPESTPVVVPEAEAELVRVLESTPEVLGEEAPVLEEVPVEVLTSDKQFVIVRNTGVDVSAPTPAATVESSSLEPGVIAQIAFAIVALALVIALAINIGSKVHMHEPKAIAYSMLLTVSTFGLMVLNNVLFVAPLVMR